MGAAILDHACGQLCLPIAKVGGQRIEHLALWRGGASCGLRWQWQQWRHHDHEISLAAVWLKCLSSPKQRTYFKREVMHILWRTVKFSMLEPELAKTTKPFAPKVLGAASLLGTPGNLQADAKTGFSVVFKTLVTYHLERKLGVRPVSFSVCQQFHHFLAQWFFTDLTTNKKPLPPNRSA